MVGAGHAAYADRFHELSRLVPHLVTPKKNIERYMYGLAPQIRGMVAIMEPTTIQKVVQIAGTLTDEAIRNGSIKKNPEKRGIEENLARIGMEGMITREIEMEMLLLQPQILLGERTRVGNPSVPPDSEPSKCQNPATARRACFECGGTNHYKPACPRLNQSQGPGVNRPNQALAIDGG
ncbi:hypothetical protein Tco_1453899 [Tanacetum coccineum]